LHDLGSMHEARGSEGDHLGLLRAPLHQRGGPLAGTVQRVRLLAGFDHAAIDQAGHDGRQLPHGDRDHGLVQERESRLYLLHLSPHLHRSLPALAAPWADALYV
jgi:hypothetical protein